MSVNSSGKQKSATSYSSSALARKQAKVEAARTRLKFLDQEKELMDRQLRLEEEKARIKLDSLRRKKELDIKLTQLSHEKELAVAEAEVEAWGSQEEIEGDDDYRLADIPLPEDNRPPSPRSRTKEYVEKNFNNPATCNPDAVPTIPQTAISSDSGTAEFAKFLLKKDLLFARLSTFTEEPEAYLSWKEKGGFKRVMNELSVDAAEEIELLIKWLGPIYSTYARSIKVSNVNNPVIGLERLWERLDDRYGCPYLIEKALKRKLDRFPKLSNKDYKKLCELTDILAEIQSTKEDDQYHDLLAYYDTSSGVIPIVRKLPHSLQEKWPSRAVRYKKERKVTFSSFCKFLAFIQEMSQIKNDPGFMYDVNNNQEKLSSTGTQNRLRVHVKKTEVTRN